MGSTNQIPGATGEWIVPEVSYVDPSRIFCTLCGRPIARQFWQAKVDGQPAPFCDPDHEELYRIWWIPAHGSESGD